jgi:steroid delta-isomerase-like uncharacterized protein
MSEENKSVIRDYIEQVFNARRLDLFEQSIAEEITVHAAVATRGRENLRKSVVIILDAFPDLQITIEDLIAEGDRVVLRDTLSGTHQGELFGIPATGEHAVWSGVWIYRLVDGKIAEIWGQADVTSLMQQLGVTPPAGQVGE